jgi:predicted dehydrogenase
MINAAIIGLGWWGKTIARALASSEVVKPLLGVDPLESERDVMAAELGMATCASFAEALARRDIQAVILCSPQTEHAAQIEAAAHAGKHVFCEKPLCTTAAEAERALAAVQKAGVTLGIGHERRFEPAVIDMKQRFAAGELGEALVFEANFSQDKFLSLPRDNWRLSPITNPVGPLSATGIHLVDLSISFLGQPKQVWAHLATRGSHFANGDMLSIMLTFESGASATLTAVLATPFMGRLALLGSKGWMEIRDRTHPEHPTGWDVTRVLRDAAPIVTAYPAHPAVRDNLEAFGRAALGIGNYPVPHHEMLANVRTFEAIQRSAANGRIESI